MTGPGFTKPLRFPFVIAGVVALLGAGLALAGYSEYQHRREATAAAEVQARVLAATVTAALAFGDRQAMAEYVDALGANPQVDAVGVFDAEGNRVASFTRSHIADRLAQTISHRTAPDRIIVTAPVIENRQRLGAVYLRNIREPLNQRLARYAAPALLILMAALMFAVAAADAIALRRANRALQAQMAEREKAEAALRQSQKMEAIGRLTGGVAHDFNNMLAIVIGSLDLLLRRHSDADPKLLRFAEQAMEGAKRAAGLTQKLLAFSRRAPLNPSSADVNRTVTDMTDLLRRTLGETIQVETVLAGGLWRARIDVLQLETAIVNLAINAKDAMPKGGRLTIETGNTYLDRAYAEDEDDVRAGQYVLVAVTDAGSGIAPEVLGQVYEPFFTTKPPGSGTGLGLSQVHGFMKQSGGHVRIYSEVGIGTTVKLYLPRTAEAAETAIAAPVRAGGSLRRNRTILVVEDEAGVREFVIEALTELGFDVVAAETPSRALVLLDQHPEVSVLLSDVVMPEINGRELAEQALKKRPALTVVFMTGYTQNAIVHNGVLDAGTHLVSKPFTVAQLGAELDAALAESGAAGSGPAQA